MRPLIAGALYFAGVFAAGLLLGIVRTLLLERAVGVLAATLIELPFMLGVSVLLARWILTRLGNGVDTLRRRESWSFSQTLVVGAIAWALLRVAELALTPLVAQPPANVDKLAFWLHAHWQRLMSPAGVAGLLAQVLFALAPALLWAAWRRKPAAPLNNDLQIVVGFAALTAPLLHTATDIIEVCQQGFSAGQRWLNYAAFLPMPWLLLGLYAVHPRRPGPVALAGAIIYGTAFIYFAHSALDAIASTSPDYSQLWAREGPLYTFHGVLMIVGGFAFSIGTWQTRWLPRPAVVLLACGLIVNLVVGILPVPAILQTCGSAIRNAGLIWMGVAVLRSL